MKTTPFAITAALLLALGQLAYAEDTTTTAPAAGDTITATDTSATAAAASDSATDAASISNNSPLVAEADKPRSPEEKSRDIIVVRENLDTVFIFDKSVFRYVAKDWRSNIDIFRQRGYGLAGSSMYDANAIFTKPVRDLAENDPYLSGKRFNFSRYACEPFLVSGGVGYIGLGDGFRLGGGGMSGERKFTSNRFSDDSILVLNTKVSYGGLLIEKCMLRGRWNLSAGGEIGAGSFNVTLSEQANTFFYGDGDFDDEHDFNDGNSSRSMFFLLEPHAGFSYTFFYFFHIGGSISLPTFMSLEKFSAYTSDYFTVNPGLHIKLIFGNLG